MKNIIIVVLLLALGGLGLYFYQTRNDEPGVLNGVPNNTDGGNGTTTPTTPFAYKDLVRLEEPLRNQLITSPLTISGEARGNWFFEASFPLELLDGNGNRVVIIPVQAVGDWMTTDFVPFEAELEFTAPSTATGTLVFHKDNPSGLPEHDDSFEIPVRFR